MANCKFCGKPVKTARVQHRECLIAAAASMFQIFCDDFCKWPSLYEDEEQMHEQRCSECPILNIINLKI